MVLSTNLLASLAERVAEPLKTLVQSITRGSASRLDVLQKMLAKGLSIMA
jgi:hypothetical protein